MSTRELQQRLLDSMESAVVTVAAADLALVQPELSAHLAMEEETVGLAQENLQALAGRRFFVQEFLLNYLRRDEVKHRDLLAALESLHDTQPAAD